MERETKRVSKKASQLSQLSQLIVALEVETLDSPLRPSYYLKSVLDSSDEW